MKKCHGIIYMAQNIQNNKVYIGQTINGLNWRKGKHEYDSKYPGDIGRFHSAIRKYGKHNFKWKILGECNSQKQLDKAERCCIEFFQSTNKIYGYNMANGSVSSVGYRHSKDSKDKMSQVKIQKGNAKGCKNAMHGITMIQRLINKHGEEEGTKRYWEWRKKQSKNSSGKNNPMFGKSMIERLINKYGETVGNEKYLQWKNKQQQNKIGDKNPSHQAKIKRSFK